MNEWLAVINLMGFVVVGAATWYHNWRNGSGVASATLTATYEKQIAAFKEDLAQSERRYKEELERVEKRYTDEIIQARERNHSLGNQLQKITLDIGIMKGQVSEKDKKIEELMEILQNRDPHLQEILHDIRNFMQVLYDKAQKNEQRNKNIDQSTEQETGHVLRKGKTA